MPDKYDFEGALNKALQEYLDLPKDQQAPIQMMVLARKYAPRNRQEALSALNGYPWLMAREAKPGFMLMDVVIATVTHDLFWGLHVKINEIVDRAAGDAALAAVRDKIIVPGRS